VQTLKVRLFCLTNATFISATPEDAQSENDPFEIEYELPPIFFNSVNMYMLVLRSSSSYLIFFFFVGEITSYSSRITSEIEG
jgi:hypothetical protein